VLRNSAVTQRAIDFTFNLIERLRADSPNEAWTVGVSESKLPVFICSIMGQITPAALSPITGVGMREHVESLIVTLSSEFTAPVEFTLNGVVLCGGPEAAAAAEGAAGAAEEAAAAPPAAAVQPAAPAQDGEEDVPEAEEEEVGEEEEEEEEELGEPDEAGYLDSVCGPDWDK